MIDGTLFEQIKSFFQGRYVKLTLLTAVTALGIYVMLYAFFTLIGIKESMPNGMMMVLSLFGSGWLVYKYVSNRIG